MFHPEVVNLSQLHLMAMTHQGPAAQLPVTIDRFIAWRKAHHLSPLVSRTFNLVHDIPNTMGDLHLDLCVLVAADAPYSSGAVVRRVIPAGRYAWLRHRGSDAGLAGVVASLEQWLLGQGERRGDFPLVIERSHFFPDVEESEWILDVYLLLA